MNALTTPNAPTTTIAADSPLGLLMDMQRFDHLQRVGKMLALSPLFPQHLRGGSLDQGIANGVLVLNMAHRLREDPLTVAQNIYFVGGRPGWNTTYMIAKANQHGVFKDVIDWDVKGKADTLSVTAFAVLSGTGKRVQVTLDMETAKKEGWTKNTKYNSIPEQMLRYRTAAFLIRLYCPEVMIGVPAAIEIELEAKDITPDGGPVVVEATKDEPIEVKAEVVDTAAATVKATAEDQRAAEAKAEAARQAKAKADEEAKRQADLAAEAAKATTQNQTAGDPLDLRADEGNQAAQGDGADIERWEYLLSMMEAELESGTTPQDLEETYGPQMVQIKAMFPALGQRLDAALAKAANR